MNEDINNIDSERKSDMAYIKNRLNALNGSVPHEG